MDKEERENYLNSALEAARVAGEVLRMYWGGLREIEEKQIPGDLVTQADRESEKEIINVLRSRHPDHHIWAEESGKHEEDGSDFLWAVDPLDGTTNYAHKLPIAAVSIALLFQNEPIVGVIFNPMQEELYQAYQGGGAFLNQKPIHVSEHLTLHESLLVTGFAYDRRETKDNNFAEFQHLTNISQGVRRLGSAALDLAYVADGRIDGFWERGLNLWDVAAGAVIVREAGGKVTSYDGGALDLKSGRILATNGHIHDELSKELVAVRDEQRSRG